MAKTMKAAVAHAFGQPLNIDEVPIPTPGPGEVLVKVIASGVCHTDLHAAAGDWPVKPSVPFIPGHEGTGFVAALGAGVKRCAKAIVLGSPGSMTPAVAASIALPGGKHCVNRNTTADTA